MGYGVYSEIYLAINNNNNIKIGETTNINRRQKQLDKEGYEIIKFRSINGGKAERLFFESYLRLFLYSLDCAIPYHGLDYFIMSNTKNIDFIIENFDIIINEAEDILKKSFLSEEEKKVNNLLAEIPTNYQYTFRQILSDLKEYNHCTHYGQYGYRKVKEITELLDNIIKPLGYNYKIEENWSWIYFIISKE